MLELLGERNERIEQLEMDVRVGWCLLVGGSCLAFLLAARPTCFPEILVCSELSRRASCLRHYPHSPYHLLVLHASGAVNNFPPALPARPPARPPALQEMKLIFHQQLSIAADQLHAALKQLEQQQQRQQQQQQQQQDAAG
jgi:hypothetical protein